MVFGLPPKLNSPPGACFAGAKRLPPECGCRRRLRARRVKASHRLLSFRPSQSEEQAMAESVYKIIELVGTSPTSWEKAAAAAVERAASTLRDLRIAEVVEQDLVITDGKVEAYRVRLKVSFKYEE